jgi:aldehyde:ferredoxin oxidoreductase
MLGFTTGPLVGTPAITGSRFTVCGKSPLTGTWGDANCGGRFGPVLKFAGFDAVFFSGAAAQPVYLWVENGKAELRDAGWLWGKDSIETEEALEEKFGKDIRVACIGQAGEMLSLIAGVMNDKGRAAARSGLGAVMGSKKLKAVVVKGNQQVPIANPDEMNELRKKYLKELDRPDVHFFRKYGTIDHVASSAFSNDSPVKNWAGVGVEDFPQAKQISDDAILKYEVKKYACWHCPIACGGIYRVENGPYAVEEVHKPEYETCGMFGNNLLNDNVESLFKLNDICNRYGLDTISAGSAIGFAIECYEKGLITKEDTDGIELTWGNHAAIVAMTEKLAKRQGFGTVLADGVAKAAERIGKGSEEFAVHVGGQELPAHDPRFVPSWGISYAVDATPGRHTQLGLVPYDQGGGYRGLDLGEKVEKYSYKGKGRLHAKVHNLLHAFYSTGVCMFAVTRINVNAWPEFLSAVTGKTYTLADMQLIGDRIGALRQAFNIREGVNVTNFYISGRAYGYPPQGKGPLAEVTLPIKDMAKEYYQAQGWDVETGCPGKESLVQLGLTFVAEELYR